MFRVPGGFVSSGRLEKESPLLLESVQVQGSGGAEVPEIRCKEHVHSLKISLDVKDHPVL